MGQANLRRRGVFVVLAAAIVVAALACGSVGLLLMPALLLAVPLVLGRYPGEELIARLARARHRAGPVRPARRIPMPRAPRRLGRRLAPLAATGASRAPPIPA